MSPTQKPPTNQPTKQANTPSYKTKGGAEEPYNWFVDKTIKNQLKNKYNLFIQQLTRVILEHHLHSTTTTYYSSTLYSYRNVYCYHVRRVCLLSLSKSHSSSSLLRLRHPLLLPQNCLFLTASACTSSITVVRHPNVYESEGAQKTRPHKGISLSICMNILPPTHSYLNI